MTTLLAAIIFVRPFIASLSFPYLNYIYSFLLLGFLIAYIMLKGISFKQNEPKAAILLLFLALFSSLIFANNKISSAWELHKYISGVLLLAVCSSLTCQNKNKVILYITAAGILISLMAIYQYFFGFRHLINYINKAKITNTFILDYVNQKRIFFPFITPNTLGGYLVMIIPLALSYKNKVWLTLPLFCALFLTKSIGAILSLFLALSICSFLQDKLRKKNMLLLAGLLITCGLIFLIRTHAQKQHLQPFFSTMMRLNYWWDTLGIIIKHPLTGIGLGNFNLTYSRYSHNSYLQIWAEAGLPAIIAFLWLVTAIFKSGLKTLKESCDKTKTPALICASCAFLIHNLIDFSFFLPEVNLVWWAIMGFLLNRNRPQEQQSR